ncbi:MAG: galactokinase [Acidobacteria bacterium]|nr:galactokinase [Acidobacteriota bacterium]
MTQRNAPAPALAKAACARFSDRFCAAPARVCFAPGRVNLIGEHTDYNEGFVLPMAIDRGIAVAAAPRRDGVIRAHSPAFGETREAALDALGPARQLGWFTYVAGVAWAMREAGYVVAGADLAIESDLPSGSGLSSSAALEVACARALTDLAGERWDPVAAAGLCRRAENEFVGVACGIMDQFASALSRPGEALLLDCRSLESTGVRVPPTAVFAVLDTAVPRALAASAYNDRRAACEAAIVAIQRVAPAVRALRDVDRALLASAGDGLDPIVRRRAQHVVDENLRPGAMAAALRERDLAAAGRLIDASHESLRTLYDVSSPHLDAIVRIARRQPGCAGARMTGAGFGGCAVALLHRDAAGGFSDAVRDAYRAETGRPGQVFLVSPAGGARMMACTTGA